MTNSRFGPEFGLLVKRRRAERGLSQDQLAAIIWPEVAGPKDHPNKPQLSRLETGKVPNPQEKTVLALCEALGIREDEVNALRLAPPPDPYGLARVLTDLKSASQDDLYALARAFGDAEPEQRSDAALRAFLADKAREHANYQKIIDALDDRVAAIANLKGAAQDAAARLDFDQVESLLSRVHEVELDIAAATAEARAENALMQGKAEHAFTLFSAAADSFAGIGPVDVAKRRRSYAERLIDHATRYGGPALTLGVHLFDKLVADFPREASLSFKLSTLNSHAQACQILAEWTAGQAGVELLTKSKTLYEEILQSLDRAREPEFWSMTLHNLAIVFQVQARLSSGSEAIKLLKQAAANYEEALIVRTRSAHPEYWADSSQNLGNTLRALAERNEIGLALGYFERAISLFEAVTEIRTKEAFPANWSIVKQNLGLTLFRFGERTEGEASLLRLNRSVDEFKLALSLLQSNN